MSPRDFPTEDFFKDGAVDRYSPAHRYLCNSFTFRLQKRHQSFRPHLIMDNETLERCQGCNSVLTGPSDIPGFIECRYCECVYPVRLPRRERDLFSFLS